MAKPAEPAEPAEPCPPATIRGPVFVRRPDPPRRKVWMLLLITLAALVPVGVGLVVSWLAGKAAAPTGPRLPPTVDVTSSTGSIRVQPAAYSWTSGAHHAVDPGGGLRAEPSVQVAPNGSLDIDFSGNAVPTSVELGLGSTKAGEAVAPSNPVRVEFHKRAGTYSVVVSTNWTQGQVAYDFQVKVS